MDVYFGHFVNASLPPSRAVATQSCVDGSRLNRALNTVPTGYRDAIPSVRLNGRHVTEGGSAKCQRKYRRVAPVGIDELSDRGRRESHSPTLGPRRFPAPRRRRARWKLGGLWRGASRPTTGPAARHVDRGHAAPPAHSRFQPREVKDGRRACGRASFRRSRPGGRTDGPGGSHSPRPRSRLAPTIPVLALSESTLALGPPMRRSKYRRRLVSPRTPTWLHFVARSSQSQAGSHGAALRAAACSSRPPEGVTVGTRRAVVNRSAFVTSVGITCDDHA